MTLLDGEGKLVVAWPRSPLPASLLKAINSPNPDTRLGAVTKLETLLMGAAVGLARSARAELERMARVEIPRVREAARAALDRHPAGEPQPRRRRRLAAALMAGILVLALAGFFLLRHDTPVVAKPRTVNVGAFYVLKGADASADREALEGTQFAVDFINGAHGLAAAYGDGDAKPGERLPLQPGQGLPGLGGAKLHLVTPRAVPDPCTVDTLFGDMVRLDKVAGVVGAYASTITLRTMVPAARDHVVLINGGSTVSSLTQPSKGGTIKVCGKQTAPDPRGSPWFYRVGADESDAARQLYAYVHAALKGKLHTVAVVHESRNIYGNSAVSDTRTALAPHHITVKAAYTYNSVLQNAQPVAPSPCPEQQRVNQIHALVMQLKKDRPDAVFAAGYPPDAILVVQMMAKLHYTPKLMVTYGSGYLGDGFIKGANTPNPLCGLPAHDPVGIVAPATWAADSAGQTGPAQRIQDLFAKQFKHPMTSRSAVSFTAMMSLAQAISEAGSTNHVAIRDKLHDLELPAGATIMPWHGIRFDDFGKNLRAEDLLQQVRDGGYHVVYPADRVP